MISYKIIAIVGALSVLFPIIIGFSFYKNISLNEKIILFLLVTVGLFDIFFYVTNKSHINNISVLNLFTIIEFIFIAIFYSQILGSFYKRRTIIIIYSIVLLVLLSSQGMDLIHNIDFITISIASVSIMVSSIVLILKSNFSDLSFNINNISIKIINNTFLFYFSTTFIIYLLSDWVIVNHYDSFKYIWAINGLVSFITNLLFTLALWKARFQTK
ncbi:MAG: hypothetical protein DRI86_08445 [Bacteroidetes bacterium]|nr:MAG: hypothetical protein DRI86_08445 [Bacteroidota bacterium]